MSETTQQIVIGLAIGIPSFALGLLGWLRARKTDMQTMSGKQIDQLLQGNKDMIDNLRQDNDDLRERQDEIEKKSKKCLDERDQLKRQVVQLTKRLDRLEKKDETSRKKRTK